MSINFCFPVELDQKPQIGATELSQKQIKVAGQRWKTEIDALEIPVPDGEHDVTCTGIMHCSVLPG
jgi:hypothetical protein